MRSRRLLIALLVLAGLAGLGVAAARLDVFGPAPVTADAGADDRPEVSVVAPQRGPASEDVELPGNINAWYEAPIYAQVAGYVANWTFDYGAKVKQGAVLATITTPVLDQQYATAEARLSEAQTRLQLASVTARRWQSLSGTQAVAQQEVDVQVADAAAQAAEVQAAKYQVERYRALEQFKRIVAPFDGVVTARRTDVGNFVSPAGGDAGARTGAAELFTVADISRLRVFVSVPEPYAGALKPGLTVRMSLSQLPGRMVEANFRTSALSFDEQSRSVVAEFTLDNADHAIWPGTFAEVHVVVPSDPHVLLVPDQALLMRADGVELAVVRPDGRVHLQVVTLGLELGQTAQVVAGLAPTDRVINDPSAGLLEGEAVRVVAAAKRIASSAPGPVPDAPPSPTADAKRAVAGGGGP